MIIFKLFKLNIKVNCEKIQSLEDTKFLEVYDSLPENIRLTRSTYDLLMMDWAGGQEEWPLREWIECLQDWLTNGSNFFQGYSALNAKDKTVFDALRDAGQKIVDEINKLQPNNE